MLTKKQRKAFMENPNKCPYCGSENLDEHDFDGDSAKCDCEDCGETITVFYQLVGAE